MAFSAPPMQGQGNRPPYFHPQSGMVNGVGDGHLYQGQGTQHQPGDQDTQHQPGGQGPPGPGQYHQYSQMKDGPQVHPGPGMQPHMLHQRQPRPGPQQPRPGPQQPRPGPQQPPMMQHQMPPNIPRFSQAPTSSTGASPQVGLGYELPERVQEHFNVSSEGPSSEVIIVIFEGRSSHQGLSLERSSHHQE